MKNILLILLVLSLTACETTQNIKYGALEKVGIHKRDILVDHIKSTSKTQAQAKEEFKTAYQQLSELVAIDDNGLEQKYNKLKRAVDNSESRTAELKNRISKVDQVANDLFKEWQQEITQYQNDRLRSISANNLTVTKQRYAVIYQKMQQSYDKVIPVLRVLQDNTLYLKHNLNARAVSGLSNEVISVENKVTELIRQMELSIDESQQFIDQMENNQS